MNDRLLRIAFGLALSAVVGLGAAGCGQAPALAPTATIAPLSSPTLVASGSASAETATATITLKESAPASPTLAAPPSPAPTGSSSSSPGSLGGLKPTEPSRSSTPAARATVSAVSSPTKPPQSLLAAELAAKLTADLKKTPTPVTLTPESFLSFGGIEKVGAISVGKNSQSREIFAAYSVGMRKFQPSQSHFVAFYTKAGDSWQEIARLDMGDKDMRPSPDYVGEGSVTAVSVEKSRLWIEVKGGAGAHGGVYNLISFDGKTARLEVGHFSGSPGTSGTRDIDGDDNLEAILDDTNNYVICYACGVRIVNYTVYRWDGQKMSKLARQPLPPGLSADIAGPMKRAGELADAGLYKDASEIIAEIPQGAFTNPVVRQNAALIRVVAEGRAAEARSGPIPLLEHAFYGDYKAALDSIRPLGEKGLFVAEPKLSVVDGFQVESRQIGEPLAEATNAALAARPELAEALFLRGYAAFLIAPSNPDWQADILEAAKLAPNDPLIQQSAEHVRRINAPFMGANITPASTRSLQQLPNPASAHAPNGAAR